jgi:hypothetical protein
LPPVSPSIALAIGRDIVIIGPTIAEFRLRTFSTGKYNATRKIALYSKQLQIGQ